MVLAEIEETTDLGKRNQLTKFVSSLKELGAIELRTNQQSEQLASKYVKEGIIPEKARADAIHIAIAVVNRLDLIISWNFDHIANWKTKIGVNKINKERSYSEIDIVSPEEA